MPVKQPLLITGGNGLVGSKFKQLYQDIYDFDSLDISDKKRPVDITDLESVRAALDGSAATHIIHLAAYTDVTGAWQQTDDKTGLAWKVNVDGTDNIVRAAQETGKHLVHVSTAFVFDGEKEGLYTETDAPNPIEWYGSTKAQSERIVMNASGDWTIFRIDFPFRFDTFLKPDIVRKLAGVITSDNPYPLFANHYFGPTVIEDFSKVLDWAVRTSPTGLYHASSGERWSDYDLAHLINTTHNLDGTVIKGDVHEYLKTLDRPYQKNTAMSTEKLQNKIDFELMSVKEAIAKCVIE
ncbi:MAG: sugar nucleotide-binding protein [Pseudomonadales bacterium]|nr:sugar nucleotide-binding protein [Candidatus Woesebacteria bacterium]MCB9802210.1 sugar nucleotide-binding protein [Pseudomonadales bacterium]